jgi:hypothetical protein
LLEGEDQHARDRVEQHGGDDHDPDSQAQVGVRRARPPHHVADLSSRGRVNPSAHAPSIATAAVDSVVRAKPP